MLILIVAMASATAFMRDAAAKRTAVERTTLDSVYSAAQASHGDTIYKATCVKCHGAALEGTATDGGPLTGKPFLDNWNGLAMDQLFDKVFTTMPSDKPQSLPRKEVADVLAYVLSRNQFPAGSAALPDSMELLRDIKIATSR
ncbi:MAG TPA: cytochrome c [Gemmatimonadaceae bacterium]|nr:cytochrome c [Gemmatimonadaceae bacterium]